MSNASQFAVLASRVSKAEFLRCCVQVAMNNAREASALQNGFSLVRVSSRESETSTGNSPFTLPDRPYQQDSAQRDLGSRGSDFTRSRPTSSDALEFAPSEPENAGEPFRAQKKQPPTINLDAFLGRHPVLVQPKLSQRQKDGAPMLIEGRAVELGLRQRAPHRAHAKSLHKPQQSVPLRPLTDPAAERALLRAQKHHDNLHKHDHATAPSSSSSSLDAESPGCTWVVSEKGASNRTKEDLSVAAAFGVAVAD